MTQLPEWRITCADCPCPPSGQPPCRQRARPLSPDGLLAVWRPELARVQVWKLPGNETSELSQTAGVFAGQKPVKILDEACTAGHGVSVPIAARLPSSIPIFPSVSSIWRPQKESSVWRQWVAPVALLSTPGTALHRDLES